MQELEKQEIKIKVDFKFYLDENDSVSIQEIKEDLIKLEQLGATEICFSSNDYGGVEIEAFYTRLETDTEALNRINKQEYYKQMALTRDLELYLKLKKKFEKPLIEIQL